MEEQDKKRRKKEDEDEDGKDERGRGIRYEGGSGAAVPSNTSPRRTEVGSESADPPGMCPWRMRTIPWRRREKRGE